MAHALEPLTLVRFFGVVLQHFALALALVQAELAHVDVLVAVDLISASLPFVLFPLALVHTNDVLKRNFLLI